MEGDTNKAIVEEHVKTMGIPAQTGLHILEAAAVVGNYLKAQEGIARINEDADAAEKGVRAQMELQEKEIRRKQDELDDEKNRTSMVLNNCLVSVQNTRKHNLEPLLVEVNHVKRIIAMLKTAESITPAPHVEDGEITTYHGEYLEMLGYLYKDEYLKIRLLITENGKPKNRYSLRAYGYCAFRDNTLLKRQGGVFTYGTPSLKERESYQVRLELGSFPSIEDTKKYAENHKNKAMKRFIADYEALKAEYLEVTAKYRLSDFERITKDEKKGRNEQIQARCRT